MTAWNNWGLLQWTVVQSVSWNMWECDLARKFKFKNLWPPLPVDTVEFGSAVEDRMSPMERDICCIVMAHSPSSGSYSQFSLGTQRCRGFAGSRWFSGSWFVLDGNSGSQMYSESFIPRKISLRSWGKNCLPPQHTTCPPVSWGCSSWEWPWLLWAPPWKWMNEWMELSKWIEQGLRWCCLDLIVSEGHTLVTLKWDDPRNTGTSLFCVHVWLYGAVCLKLISGTCTLRGAVGSVCVWACMWWETSHSERAVWSAWCQDEPRNNMWLTAACCAGERLLDREGGGVHWLFAPSWLGVLGTFAIFSRPPLPEPPEFNEIFEDLGRLFQHCVIL